jgi:hypothetical protein
VQRVEEVGKSEGRPVIGRIGPPEGGDTQPERVRTSDWCLFTRKFGELPQRGKANVGGPMALAGAPSSRMIT